MNCLYACMDHLQFRDAQNKLFRDEEEKRKAEAGRDRPREDSLPHRPAPPVLAGGRQPLIKTIVARVRRFLRGGGGGGVGDPSDGDRDGGGSNRGGGRVAWRGMRELFSQYNIAVTKQGDNTTFSSIWSVDAGAGESLKFLRILALSTQLENVTNHYAAALSGRAGLIEANCVLRCMCMCVQVKYNLDYHCELMLLSLDQLDDEKLRRRRGSIRAKNGRLSDGAFYLSLHAVSVPVIECM